MLRLNSASVRTHTNNEVVATGQSLVVFSKFTGCEHSLYIIFRYSTVLKGHSRLLSCHCLRQPPSYPIFLRFSCSRYSIQTPSLTDSWQDGALTSVFPARFPDSAAQVASSSRAESERVKCRPGDLSAHICEVSAGALPDDPLAGVTPGLSQTLGTMESRFSSQSHMATPTVCREASISIALISRLHTSQQELTMA